jgi:hypothetical protein
VLAVFLRLLKSIATEPIQSRGAAVRQGIHYRIQCLARTGGCRRATALDSLSMPNYRFWLNLSSCYLKASAMLREIPRREPPGRFSASSLPGTRRSNVTVDRTFVCGPCSLEVLHGNIIERVLFAECHFARWLTSTVPKTSPLWPLCPGRACRRAPAGARSLGGALAPPGWPCASGTAGSASAAAVAVPATGKAEAPGVRALRGVRLQVRPRRVAVGGACARGPRPRPGPDLVTQ